MSKINTLLLLIFADLYLENKGKHKNITTQRIGLSLRTAPIENQRDVAITVDLKSRLIMKDEEKVLEPYKFFGTPYKTNLVSIKKCNFGVFP